jgi:hemin uptake protein HemP
VSTPTTPREAPREENLERPPPPAPGRRILNSQDLLAGEQEVLIQNGEEIYRLRRTRSGKLILYK